jgi:hypothetical protein
MPGTREFWLAPKSAFRFSAPLAFPPERAGPFKLHAGRNQRGHVLGVFRATNSRVQPRLESLFETGSGAEKLIPRNSPSLLAMDARSGYHRAVTLPAETAGSDLAYTRGKRHCVSHR